MAGDSNNSTNLKYNWKVRNRNFMEGSLSFSNFNFDGFCGNYTYLSLIS